MKISYLHEFLVEYESLDGQVRKQLFKKLDQLAITPYNEVQHQSLKGERFKGLYKLRVGDWLLIYQVIERRCVFITLGHRSDVYK